MSFSISRNSSSKYYIVRRPISGFGFSSSPFADANFECALLEKCINQGANCFIGSSSQMNSESFAKCYETLGDYLAVEDEDSGKFTVGHRFRPSITPETGKLESKSIVSDIRHELNQVFRCFQTNELNLGFLSVSPTITSASATCISSLEWRIEDAQEALEQSELASKGVKLGLDLTTEMLASTSTNQIENLLQNVGNRSEVVTLAVNPYTIHSFQSIIDWALSHKVNTIAYDILRIHPRRPGQLHSATRSGKAYPHLDLNKTVKDLEKALDLCMHIEKKFINEMAEGCDVLPTQVCWGHVLAGQQGSILYPEEWEYLYNTQAIPSLETAYTILKKSGDARRDFAMLHQPLTTVLFAAFDKVLQARKQMLVKQVSSSIDERSHAHMGSIPHELIAALVREAGVNHVCLSGLEFRSEACELMRIHVKSLSIVDEMKHLKEIYSQYYKNDM